MHQLEIRIECRPTDRNNGISTRVEMDAKVRIQNVDDDDLMQYKIMKSEFEHTMAWAKVINDIMVIWHKQFSGYVARDDHLRDVILENIQDAVALYISEVYEESEGSPPPVDWDQVFQEIVKGQSTGEEGGE